VSNSHVEWLDRREAEREKQQDELARLRAENERLRAVLEWLDRLGGLGLDKHERIRAALAGEEIKG